MDHLTTNDLIKQQFNQLVTNTKHMNSWGLQSDIITKLLRGNTIIKTNGTYGPELCV